MAKLRGKTLTKDMIIEYGIEVGEPIEGGYAIYKVKNNNNGISKRLLKPQDVYHIHKYTPTIRYVQIQFRYNGKRINIYVHRLIYAWFTGNAPYGLDIDHIDNNPQNNRIENLQAITREQNIAKKWKDNPLAKERVIYNINKMRKYDKHSWTGYREDCYNIANKEIINKYKGE